MKLSELKKLHPIAYKEFCKEVDTTISIKNLEALINGDLYRFFSNTSQGYTVWYSVFYEKDFSFFDEWYSKKNKNKPSLLKEFLIAMYHLFFFKTYTVFPRRLEIAYGVIAWIALIEFILICVFL